MPETTRPASLRAHLARGAAGFGSLLAAFALTPTLGPAALLLMIPGMVALRGCPMCWVVGLFEAVTAGRLERTCVDGSCALRVAEPEGLDATAEATAPATGPTVTAG